MILSMTGVGKSIVRHAEKSITIFIKTLNSKQIDISTRIPALYRERELEVRSLVTDYLTRGKIELSISIDDSSTSLSGVQQINREALMSYIEQIEEIRTTVFFKLDNMESLLRLPGVLVSNDTTTQELSDEEWQAVRAGIVEALESVVAFRKQEGQMLSEVLLQRINNIHSLLAQIEIPEGERINQIKTRLEEGLKKLSIEGYDKSRLEQEMIYYIEKLDVNEEKDRLRHHLGYFCDELNKPEGLQGKTLGFVAQEIGREINTLGSKSNNAEMQQLVVKMKDELEQIKEQSLNVL